ncbi:hypothetical protein SELMODRAFT_403021 [Selaginella moellendorffii]|uniref:Metaxin glutathione S-transferase domain-containing protein n=1 Tax=Selaginella moellendorffii TaxID=88036 RepID=D8QNT3_SELML|nr:hypothetical protein SELMODRAFT_403021 [Selaginella moellendorffii]
MGSLGEHWPNAAIRRVDASAIKEYAQANKHGFQLEKKPINPSRQCFAGKIYGLRLIVALHAPAGDFYSFIGCFSEFHHVFVEKALPAHLGIKDYARILGEELATFAETYHSLLPPPRKMESMHDALEVLEEIRQDARDWENDVAKLYPVLVLLPVDFLPGNDGTFGNCSGLTDDTEEPDGVPMDELCAELIDPTKLPIFTVTWDVSSRSDKEKFMRLSEYEKRGHLVLTVRPPSFHLPTACPRSLSTYLYLCLAKKPFLVEHSNADLNLPLVDWNLHTVFGSGVDDFLRSTVMCDLDVGLNEGEAAKVESLRPLFMDLDDALDLELWTKRQCRKKSGWFSLDAAGGDIETSHLPWPINKLVAWTRRARAMTRLGINWKNSEARQKEIYGRALRAYKDLSSVKQLNKDSKYLCGMRPTSLDAMLLAHILFVKRISLENSILRAALELEHPELIEYSDLGILLIAWQCVCGLGTGSAEVQGKQTMDDGKQLKKQKAGGGGDAKSREQDGKNFHEFVDKLKSNVSDEEDVVCDAWVESFKAISRLIGEMSGDTLDDPLLDRCPKLGDYKIYLEKTYEPSVSIIAESRAPSFEEIDTLNNEVLLWWGTSACNLIKGMQPAIYNAPVPGYMFGKGLYCTGASCKAVSYAFSGVDGPVILALGDDMLVFPKAGEVKLQFIVQVEK